MSLTTPVLQEGSQRVMISECAAAAIIINNTPMENL